MKNKTLFHITIGAALLFAIAGCGRKPYTQDDFSAKILQKPAWIVRLTIGKPDKVRQEANQEVWIYNRRIRATATSPATRTAWVTVKKGRIVQTAF
jgi:hypothetical protein